MTTLTKPKKEYWGGVIEFPDLEPGKYTATAEAWNTAENILEGSGSASVTVRAGKTCECNIAMILEGQTAYYSKYMLFFDSDGIMYAYDYSTCSEKEKWEYSYNLAEDNSGNVYRMYVAVTSQGYYGTPQIKKFTDTDSYELNFSSDDTNFSHTSLFDAYYDSTTDIYWVAYAYWSNSEKKLFLCKKTDKYAEIKEDSATFPFSSACIATQGENFYYSFNSSNDTNQCPDSIGYATFDYTTSGGSANKIKTKTLSDFGLSGYITDMAVLEDGTVAVLVRSAGVDSETESFNSNKNIKNNGTVYSRGALVLLAPDLSKVQKILGWTEAPRQIEAVGESDGNVTSWTSIIAYIPEYEKRNSMFFGPVKIVAIRPKELVIADCGANFVLPDYVNKKNGKMYTHNRLMTVNLRNFAIGCKKEFTEGDLEFMSLTISGGIEASSGGAWEDNYMNSIYVSEK